MTEFDVVVVGGGPAGAAVATLVAREGHRVALFEARPFPRFHVGESLVPACNRTLEKLGVLDELDHRGYITKRGVQFFSPKGPSRPFYFAEATDTSLHKTWQVLRSDFDALLLDNAIKHGVEVKTGTLVVGIDEDGGSVRGVRLRHVDRTEESVSARIVVDASGQKGLLARRFGRREHLEGLANAAAHAHFKDVVRDEGEDAGSTLIFRLGGRPWLWFIPLPKTVSIGLVAPARHITSFGDSPKEMLANAIAQCRPLQERLEGASRTTPVRMDRDFSYRAGRDGGDGWLLVGDALGFMDPMYSTGLFLSLMSAELAGEAINEKLSGAPNGNNFTGFSARYQVAFDRFLTLVRAFYDHFRFGVLAKNPSLRQGLVDLLTGDVGTPHAAEVTQAIGDLARDDVAS